VKICVCGSLVAFIIIVSWGDILVVQCVGDVFERCVFCKQCFDLLLLVVILLIVFCVG